MASKQLATVEIEVREGRTTAILDGAFTIRSVGAVEGALKDIRSDTDLLVDIERLEHLDTAGAWSLTRLEQRLQVGGGSFRLRGATSRAEALLDTVAAALDSQKRAEGSDRPEQDQGFVEQLGRRVAEGVSTLLGMTGYLGIFLSRLARLALRPRQFRVTALVHHCEDVGVRAVPIVALMGFLIGVVLAFQGGGSASPVRGRGLRGRPDLRLHPPRTRHPPDGDHRRGPHGLGLHRRDRVDEDARGDRCDAHPRSGHRERSLRAAYPGAPADAAHSGPYRECIGPCRGRPDVLDRARNFARDVPRETA